MAVSDIAERDTRRLGAKAVFASHAALTASLSVLPMLEQFTSRDRGESAIWPLCAAMLLLSVWCLWSWRRQTGRWFDPYTLFLVAVMLFNGGQAWLEVFGLNRYGLMGGRFAPETQVAALCAVLMGIAALHLGALVAMGSAASARLVNDAGGEKANSSALQTVGAGLLAIAAVPSVILLREAAALVMSSGYFSLYEQSAATGLAAGTSALAALLIPGVLFLVAGSPRSKYLLWLCVAIASAYALLQLFLGARAAGVMPVVAFAWVWHRCVRRLRGNLVVGLVCLGVAFLLPLVGATRNLPGSERTTWTSALSALAEIDKPVLEFVAESGNTLRTTAHTIELVPATRQFQYGEEYAYSALAIVPNLFWDVHPSAARQSAGTWLVWAVDPRIASLGGGLGFSPIAEAYLNFGATGVPLVMFCVGWLFGRLVAWSVATGDPARTALMGALLSFVFVFARSGSVNVVRPLVWYSLAPYLVVKAFEALVGIREARDHPGGRKRRNALVSWRKADASALTRLPQGGLRRVEKGQGIEARGL